MTSAQSFLFSSLPPSLPPSPEFHHQSQRLWWEDQFAGNFLIWGQIHLSLKVIQSPFCILVALHKEIDTVCSLYIVRGFFKKNDSCSIKNFNYYLFKGGTSKLQLLFKKAGVLSTYLLALFVQNSAHITV